MDIVEIAVGAGNFKTLVAAAQAAGLVETLKGNGPFTVFAPNDETFAKLPAGTVDSLLKEPEKLKQILLYHVVMGKVMAKDAMTLKSAKTVQGQDITLSKSTGQIGENDPAFARDPVKWHEYLRVNDAYVINADILADNGVIHVINNVIMPK